MEKALDDSTKEKQIYKVDLYHLLGKSYLFLDYCNDVESLGKILVTVSDERINPYREKAGECIEVKEGFSIPLIACSKSCYYDACYDEDVIEFHLPYKYDYWDKYRLYIIRFEDLDESHLATEEDLKNYDPQKEVWYKLLKEIQEKGIDFDYKQEAIDEMSGNAPKRSKQNSLKKTRKNTNNDTKNNQ